MLPAMEGQTVRPPTKPSTSLSSSFSLQVWSKDKEGVGRATPPFTFFCSSGTFRDGTSLQQRPHCFMRGLEAGA